MNIPTPGPRPDGPSHTPASGMSPTPDPVPTPGPPRRVQAPDAQSTGDAEIDQAVAALTGVAPEDLDAHLIAGQRVHDILRGRLDGSPGA